MNDSFSVVNLVLKLLRHDLSKDSPLNLPEPSFTNIKKKNPKNIRGKPINLWLLICRIFMIILTKNNFPPNKILKNISSPKMLSPPKILCLSKIFGQLLGVYQILGLQKIVGPENIMSPKNIRSSKNIRSQKIFCPKKY